MTKFAEKNHGTPFTVAVTTDGLTPTIKDGIEQITPEGGAGDIYLLSPQKAQDITPSELYASGFEVVSLKSGGQFACAHVDNDGVQPC